MEQQSIQFFIVYIRHAIEVSAEFNKTFYIRILWMREEMKLERLLSVLSFLRLKNIVIYLLKQVIL